MVMPNQGSFSENSSPAFLLKGASRVTKILSKNISDFAFCSIGRCMCDFYFYFSNFSGLVLLPHSEKVLGSNPPLFCKFQRFYTCADFPICTKQPSCKQATLNSRWSKMSEQKVWQINSMYSKNVTLELEFYRHWLSTDFYAFIGDFIQ